MKTCEREMEAMEFLSKHLDLVNYSRSSGDLVLASSRTMVEVVGTCYFAPPSTKVISVTMVN